MTSVRPSADLFEQAAVLLDLAEHDLEHLAVARVRDAGHPRRPFLDEGGVGPGVGRGEVTRAPRPPTDTAAGAAGTAAPTSSSARCSQ